jgi:hypothetical protein
VPALIGAFWGAPLIARELEGGTFSLAWSQSITLAAFAGAQLAMALWVRAHLITPLRSSIPFNPAHITALLISDSGQLSLTARVNRPGAWILSNQTVTAAGRPFAGPAPAACVSDTGSFQSCQRALVPLHLRQVVTYQPASRYWAFQWTETAIFLALAVALAGFCYWWIRRRRLA